MQERLRIIENFLNGSISIDEKKILRKWVMEDNDNMDFFKKQIKDYEPEATLDFDPDKAYQKFMNSVKPTKIKSNPPYKWYKYAAVFLGLLTIGFLTKNLFFDKIINPIVVVQDEENQDKGEIIITLADGTKKIIGFGNTDFVTDTKGDVIANKSEDALTFTSDKSSNFKDLVYNEVYIPFGQKFKINLSDGTRVWLNAGSRLRFPQKFVDSLKNRKVFLEGEAFFEVTKNENKPFIVNAHELDIKVLGTKFNLTSYESDNSVTTTLVEGAVSIYKTRAPEEQLRLTPSYQVTYNKLGDIFKKEKVDTSIYTAWMQDKLIINSLKFSEILKKLERIHNVTFINKTKNLEDEIYKGDFEKEDIETILNTISLSTPFKYEKKQNVITITE